MTHATENGGSPAALTSCWLWTWAKLDVSVFRDPVTPTVSMRFWRYVYNYILLKTPSLRPTVHPEYSEKSLLPRVNERAFHITHTVQLICTFFPSVCVFVWFFFYFFYFFLSGNDSVVAPSTDSHPHPLQNRALQVSIPHQGQHCTSPPCLLFDSNDYVSLWIN